MKNYFSIVVVVSSLIIIGIGYYSYNRFIAPIYANAEQEMDVVLMGNNEILLKKTDEQQQIHGIEIEITGPLDGIIDIVVANSEEDLHSIALKGDVDYIYQNDWYSDSCFLKITTRGNATGELHLIYRFLGMK
ncbi:MAG: hypothetical protein QNK23_13485 [Crocinitomicaceae bacterium]|nr:hypothetical protein [Crocinitomicaceae bacterium]